MGAIAGVAAAVGEGVPGTAVAWGSSTGVGGFSEGTLAALLVASGGSGASGTDGSPQDVATVASAIVVTATRSPMNVDANDILATIADRTQELY